MQQQQQGALSMSTLTELHVPHHHHHNLLTPSSELYLSNEHQQQQQLLQINNLLHKHDATISAPPPSTQQPQQDHQMLLYQVNQNGQIMELNHIHNQSMTNRLYKSDMMEQLEPMHDIQQSLQSTMNDNLPIIIGSGENYQQRNMVTTHEQLTNHGMTNSITHTKKRKTQNFLHQDGGENIKSFVKTESSE